MKKILSLVLVLTMALSMLVLPAFAAGEVAENYTPAAGATAISTAEEFIAMTADGNYYLKNDITLTASYEAGFTGTFDGCGHTVTTTVPMFKDFGGTAKNFTVKGEIAGAAAVAATSTCVAAGGKVVFENILNDAKITSETYAGSLIGQLGTNEADFGANLEVTNCVNNGDITAAKEVGGFVAAAYFNKNAKINTEAGATFTGCTNNGTILSTGGYTGGLFGRPMYTKAGVKFVGCVNNGDVTGLKNTGGFVGHTTNSCFFASYCVNNGNIKSTDAGKGSDRYAGGIIAYAQGIKLADYAASNGGVANRIEYCLNTGTITGRSNTAGIVAHTGASGTYGLSSVTYCVNIGNVVAEDVDNSQSGNCAAGIIGYTYGNDKGNQTTEIKNCITTGDITMSWAGEGSPATPGTAGYFLGYCSSTDADIVDNIASGTITSSGTVYAFGWDNKFSFKSLTGNQLPEGCEYDLTYENGTITKTSDNKEGYAWTKTDLTALTSGEFVYNFNKGYKAASGATEDILFMVIDGNFAPTTVKADNNVVYINASGAYTNNASEGTTDPGTETTQKPDETTQKPDETTQKEVETTKTPGDETTKKPDDQTTKEPEQTKEPDQTEAPAEDKGCKSVVVSGIAVVVMAAAAVVALKKKD